MTIRFDRPEFDRLLGQIRAGKQDLPVIAPGQKVSSSDEAIVRFVETLERMGHLWERYEDKLGHDLNLTDTACERLEQVDIEQARRVAGSDGMTVFASHPGADPARRGLGNEAV